MIDLLVCALVAVACTLDAAWPDMILNRRGRICLQWARLLSASIVLCWGMWLVLIMVTNLSKPNQFTFAESIVIVGLVFLSVNAIIRHHGIEKR